MRESLYLFNEVLNSRWFTQAQFFLLFTKDDIFSELIKSVCLSITFPEYTVGNNREEALTFFHEIFKRQQSYQRNKHDIKQFTLSLIGNITQHITNFKMIYKCGVSFIKLRMHF
jgi:hypothetical protein